MTRDDLRLALIGIYSPRLATRKHLTEEKPSMKEALAFPKPVRMEDSSYRRFIRRQPCVVCGAASEHAHIVPAGWGKTGSKASDYRGIPLCRNHHRTDRRSIHAIGRERFEAEQNLDLDLIQIQYLETYLSALRDGEDLGK